MAALPLPLLLLVAAGAVVGTVIVKVSWSACASCTRQSQLQGARQRPEEVRFNRIACKCLRVGCMQVRLRGL